MSGEFIIGILAALGLGSMFKDKTTTTPFTPAPGMDILDIADQNEPESSAPTSGLIDRIVINGPPVNPLSSGPGAVFVGPTLVEWKGHTYRTPGSAQTNKYDLGEGDMGCEPAVPEAWQKVDQSAWANNYTCPDPNCSSTVPTWDAINQVYVPNEPAQCSQTVYAGQAAIACPTCGCQYAINSGGSVGARVFVGGGNHKTSTGAGY